MYHCLFRFGHKYTKEALLHNIFERQFVVTRKWKYAASAAEFSASVFDWKLSVLLTDFFRKTNTISQNYNYWKEWQWVVLTNPDFLQLWGSNKLLAHSFGFTAHNLFGSLSPVSSLFLSQLRGVGLGGKGGTDVKRPYKEWVDMDLGNGPIENADVQGPEFCATSLAQLQWKALINPVWPNLPASPHTADRKS